MEVLPFSSLINKLVEFLTVPNGGLMFCSIPFWATFLVFYLIYIGITYRTRTGMLIYVVLFSLFFFYKANGWLMLLLPATAILSWYLTRIMDGKEGKQKKGWLLLLILLNLGPLVYFKYTNFLINTWNEIFTTNFSFLSLVLPIGISFYTFQSISYSMDIYRGKFNGKVTLLEYLFYLSFFPLLLAGPITRADTLFPQIRQKIRPDNRLLYTGLWLILSGFIKKGLIADYIAQYNNWIFESPLTYSGFENMMGAVGYSIQIYCDFSGYSDFSIGLAALLGIRLKDNFNFPYQACNLTDFWHRWHISLSTWFRDYLYIPLGGNRKGDVRTYLNSFITMVVAGLWHGASWMFVIWGALHGIGLVVHKWCKRHGLDRIPDTRLIIVLSWTATFIYLTITWTFFRADSLEICRQIFTQIGTDFDIAYLIPFIKARPVWCIFVVAALLFQGIRERHYQRITDWFIGSHWVIKLILTIFVVQLVLQFHQENVQPFIYYQF
ncbi:MBOAT family protein [uncultured Bacteroides sp.]|uniref:MBOAT family O-acyltransferase n=1 Tax=uncultured Bacteroides sp. TaxID=162156 RepID=UPI00261C8217|nr:MBOAT family O-acyltransferase [uncultured Bacteroides sp.]